MDQGPLVSEQIEAGATFLREFQKNFPVQVAFWLKDSESGERYLYVASEQITDENFDVAYGEVARIWKEIQEPWFDPFKVKVIGDQDPLAKAALEALQRRGGRGPVRLYGQVFGGIAVDEVYVYPVMTVTPASETGHAGIA
jgi:hypothetical protein